MTRRHRFLEGDEDNDEDNENEVSQRSALFVLRDSVGWEKDDGDEDWPLDYWEDDGRISLEELCTVVPGLVCQEQEAEEGEEDGQKQWAITMINWSSRGLKGSIPTEIGQLSTLVSLQMGMNELYGTIPESLSQLSLLVHLELHKNELFGTLPEGIWSNMSSLKRLLLHTNQIEGTLPSTLCQLISLHSMDLFDNPFLSGSLPDCFGTMTQLVTLQISGTKLSGTIPSELCIRHHEDEENNRRMAYPSLRRGIESISCDTIACPIGTYATPYGYDTESTPCRTCPTAIYLASKDCPEIDEEVSMSPMESTPVPTTTTTTSPTRTTLVGDLVLPMTPTPTSSAPTRRPSLQPQNGNNTWITTYSPVSSGLANDRDIPRSPTVSHWTLLSIACLLSSLALLIVVWIRHRRLMDNNNDSRPQHHPQQNTEGGLRAPCQPCREVARCCCCCWCCCCHRPPRWMSWHLSQPGNTTQDSPTAAATVSADATSPPVLDTDGQDIITTNVLMAEPRMMMMMTTERWTSNSGEEMGHSTIPSSKSTGSVGSTSPTTSPQRQQPKQLQLPHSPNRRLLSPYWEPSTVSMLLPPTTSSLYRQWDGDIPPAGHIRYLQQFLMMEPHRIPRHPEEHEDDEGQSGISCRQGPSYGQSVTSMTIDNDSIESDSGWNDSISSGDEMDGKSRILVEEESWKHHPWKNHSTNPPS